MKKILLTIAVALALTGSAKAEFVGKNDGIRGHWTNLGNGPNMTITHDGVVADYGETQQFFHFKSFDFDPTTHTIEVTFDDATFDYNWTIYKTHGRMILVEVTQEKDGKFVPGDVQTFVKDR